MNIKSDNSQDNDALTRVTHYVDREGLLREYPRLSNNEIEAIDEAAYVRAMLKERGINLRDFTEDDFTEMSDIKIWPWQKKTTKFWFLKMKIAQRWKRVKQWLTGQ